MIEINFKYKKKNNIIKCKEDDNIGDVCQQFKDQVKLKNIFFIYEEKKINLELNMRISDLLHLDYNKKRKKRYEIIVYDEAIQVKIGYSGKETYINMYENEKIEDILKRFANNNNKNFDDIYFLYNGDVITEDKYNLTFDNFASQRDKEGLTMSLIMNDADRDSISLKGTFKNEINSDDIELPNNLRENMLQNKIEIDPQILEQRSFYLKFLLIILIQYICIVFFSWFGFFLDLNKHFLKDNRTLIMEVIPVIIILIIMSGYMNYLIYKNSQSKYIIIFHVLSPLLTIYFSFLLSKYVEPKYILTSLSLILTEIAAMEIYLLLIKNYKYLLIILCYIILSLVGLILFSIFLVKELLPIVFISIFWIFSLGYLFLHIQIILKLCKLDEYFYACIIFNYGLFLGMAFLLEKFYNMIKAKLNTFEDNLILLLKTYSIFIIQYVIIIFFLSLGFNFEWNKVVIESSYNITWFCVVTTIINFIMCLILFILIYVNEEKSIYIVQNKSWYIYHVFYIPFIIIYSFIFSKIIEPKFILGLMIIFLLNLISIELYIFISKSSDLIGIFFSPVITNIISIIILHFSWLKNNNAIIANSIIPFVFIILWTILSNIFKDGDYGSDDYNISILTFNYGFFIIIYFLSVMLTLGLLGLVLYLISLILSCLCGGCD